ncbi:MAG: response regulator transcription factor [Bacillus sp. (in: firmicutes)]
MSSQSIVIVEDELIMRDVIRLYLQKEGYDVSAFGNAEEAWEQISNRIPSLILLDVNLPGETGFQLAKKIREKSRGSSIIFLTGYSGLREKLIGFEIGADDYITKPFVMAELLARVKAHLRKDKSLQEIHDHEVLVFGNLKLDLTTKAVYKHNVEVDLFVKEKKLLFYLAVNRNRVYSAERLFEHIWGIDSEAELKTVAVHISNIRKKIEDDSKKPEYLHTVRGFGYKFSYQ